MSRAKGTTEPWHSDAKKIEVVTSYLILGKVPLVEAVTGVPSGTIRRWKYEPWWTELVEQIQTESDQELDAKLEKRIAKVMDLVEDRLEKGDFQYDPHTGTFVRRPVSIKDGWRVGKEMIDLRAHMRSRKKEQLNQEAVSDVLKSLATEFAAMARKKIKDGEELQERVSEVSGDAGANQEASQTEQSPQDNGAGGAGS